MATLLHRVGEALYGPRWQSDLASALGVSDRTVRRWVSGDNVPSPGVWADLARLMRDRTAHLKALELECSNPLAEGEE